MARYNLAGHELHTAWILRPYIEQEGIPGFDTMSYAARRASVERARNAQLLKLQQRRGGHKAYRQARKNYEKSDAYIHLTQRERFKLVEDVADKIGLWGFARLFAECIDKLHFDPHKTHRTVEEQAFEQVVSRFERYLSNINAGSQKSYGIIVHDNNETVAKRHTLLMRNFHQDGTLWTRIESIIETPMFVDSGLTSMVQAADLCAYALRRFVENKNTNLFARIFPRADKYGGNTVGVRHYSSMSCSCQICDSHG